MADGGHTNFSDVICELGEGPSYDPRADTLFWFDIVARKLLAKNVSGGGTTTHDLPVMASALGVVDDDRQLLVTENGLQLRDAGTGKLTMHTAVEAHLPNNRSNDARVHPSGAFWFGTMSRIGEKKAGSIYWFRGGEVRRLFGDISVPNSICFSPDSRIAYYTDNANKTVMRVACDPATGLPTGDPAPFFSLDDNDGSPDGSVVDADGILWNAVWRGGRVDAYSPDGKRIRSIALPARQTTCPAFVGRSAERLAVTSAWEHMSDAERAGDPQAGTTFLLDVPVKGRFEPRVLL